MLEKIKKEKKQEIATYIYVEFFFDKRNASISSWRRKTIVGGGTEQKRHSDMYIYTYIYIHKTSFLSFSLSSFLIFFLFLLIVDDFVLFFLLQLYNCSEYLIKLFFCFLIELQTCVNIRE